jgi:hypothetical protein
LDGSGTEPNCLYHPNPDRWRVTRTRCYQYIQLFKNWLIGNRVSVLHSQITDEHHLGLVTQNQLMLEMLLQNKTQWNAKQTLQRQRLGPQGKVWLPHGINELHQQQT